jgi:predicted ThiF/HesA family dinucleotide-utilizing enzyme
MTYFTHEQRYRDLARVAERPITICGAGALGANLAETLARMGLRRLRVVDRDRVEARNLSTQPWAQQDVGAPKARVLAGALYRAVGARVDAQHAELAAANALQLLEGSAVVVDAFDNLPSRALVGRTADALGAPCLHIALGPEGDYGCGLRDGAYRTIDRREATGDEQRAEDTCDYPLTRPLAMLVASAAAEVLACHLLDGSRRGFELTLRDLRLTSR